MILRIYSFFVILLTRFYIFDRHLAKLDLLGHLSKI